MNIEVNIPEKIINKLREAKIPLNKGASIARISKEIRVSDHIYYRWRRVSMKGAL